MDTVKCGLCAYSGISDLERDYFSKRKSLDEIKEELKINDLQSSNYSWYQHIKYHLKPEVVKNLPAKVIDDVIDKISVITESLDRLHKVVNMTETAMMADATDPKLIDSYLKAEAGIRANLLLLDKVQEGWQDAKSINIKSLHVEYNQMMGQVLENTCPMCKAKLANILKVTDDSNKDRTDL